MRLVYLKQPKIRRQRHIRVRHLLWAICISAVILTANTFRPLNPANVTLTLPNTSNAESLQLAWPSTGEAAIAADGHDVLTTYGDNTPIATASIAKVITALCVLQKYPLVIGQTGPTLTFSKQDVALYQYQLEHNGSSIAVYEGGQMSELEAIEAMLLPSANNIADSLAIWAFGSLDNYATYANTYVLQHGLIATHVGVDASGLDPSTVSTATDLARLGLLAESEPVIMSVAAMRSATLPNIGTVYNYNSTLGVNSINGLKTGNNDQNKGALLFTANITVSGKVIAVSGAVVGQASLPAALATSTQLVGSIPANFELYTYVTKGQTIGVATTAWGTKVPVKALKTAQLIRWKGDAVTTKQTIHVTKADKAGSIGALNVIAGSVQTSVTLSLDSSATGPSYWWRATRL